MKYATLLYIAYHEQINDSSNHKLSSTTINKTINTQIQLKTKNPTLVHHHQKFQRQVLQISLPCRHRLRSSNIFCYKVKNDIKNVSKHELIK